MCGIAGIVEFSPSGPRPADASLRRMNAALAHRGPDDSGVFVRDGVGFAHVRLSILDLSPLGHQPMEDTQKTCVLTYNGEIYNFLELKEELGRLGHHLRGGSD